MKENFKKLIKSLAEAIKKNKKVAAGIGIPVLLAGSYFAGKSTGHTAADHGRKKTASDSTEKTGFDKTALKINKKIIKKIFPPTGPNTLRWYEVPGGIVKDIIKWKEIGRAIKNPVKFFKTGENKTNFVFNKTAQWITSQWDSNTILKFKNNPKAMKILSDEALSKEEKKNALIKANLGKLEKIGEVSAKEKADQKYAIAKSYEHEGHPRKAKEYKNKASRAYKRAWEKKAFDYSKVLKAKNIFAKEAPPWLKKLNKFTASNKGALAIGGLAVGTVLYSERDKIKKSLEKKANLKSKNKI